MSVLSISLLSSSLLHMLVAPLHKLISLHFASDWGAAEHYPSEVVQWYSDDTRVCMCQLSRDWLLSLSTDWRWDLEEKLLLLCLLYGSFFTLNAENLCRGHRIPASLHRPELIFAALGIDKAFNGAKYAGYVLQLSSLYFPAASLLGVVQPRSAGVLEMSTTHKHMRAGSELNRGRAAAPLSESRAASTSCDKR